MGHQRTLHLEGADAVAAGFDYIVDAPFEPIVAVLVAPCHIAGMVDAVVPGLAGFLFVTVVAFEQANGLLVAYTNHYFSFLTILTWRTVGTQQVNVVLGVGDAHRTGFGFHPGEGAQCHGSLRLAETFHHADACFFKEFVEDCGVQRLAGSAAVLQCRKVVLRQILANHETVDGRRRTERCHVVFLHLPQQRVGIEFLMVEDEHGGTGKPLAVELTPYGLAPACVSHGEMQGTRVQVVPEDASRQMSHGVEIVVRHHLGFATGTRGEIHQHCVIVGIDEGGPYKWWNLLPLFQVVVETLGHMVANGHQCFDGRTLGHGGLHLAHHIGIVDADNSLDTGSRVTVHDVVFGQHVGSRNDDGTNLTQG